MPPLAGSIATSAPLRSPKGVLGDALQFGVDGQRQLVAGHRRRVREGAHGAAAGIDLDLLVAADAVQVEFVALLQPGFAEVVGAAIVGVLLARLDLFQVAVGDAADVAEDVRCERAAGVLAEQARLDLDAGESGSGGR
jgi:hypothetical protein